MNQRRLSAVILAAGESSRMGEPKPLIKIANKTFFEIIKKKIIAAGIKDIHMVLGAESGTIISVLNPKGINIIINKLWQQGQISSLKKAVEYLSDRTDAIIMFLIDHPQIEITTIKQLIDKYKNGSADIIIPEYEGRGGHPVIIANSVYRAILEAPLNSGARSVFRKSEFNSVRVKVNDPNIRQDIDTKEDYHGIKN